MFSLLEEETKKQFDFNRRSGALSTSKPLDPIVCLLRLAQLILACAKMYSCYSYIY